MRIILYNPSIPSPEIAKRLKNQVEEQRAYATLGRVLRCRFDVQKIKIFIHVRAHCLFYCLLPIRA